MEKIIQITENKYQEFRREVLLNLGITLKIIFGDKYLMWNFEKNKFANEKPKHATIEEYMENMIEKEILEIYQHFVFTGVRTLENNEIVIKPLTSKYQIVTMNTEQHNTKNKNEGWNTDMVTSIRDIENNMMMGRYEEKTIEKANQFLRRIENRDSRVDKWDLENNEGTYGSEIVITKDGHIDFYLHIMKKYDYKITNVRVANFQPEFGCGDMYLLNGGEKEYKKLGNMVKALDKLYSQYGFYFNDKDAKNALVIAKKEYELSREEEKIKGISILDNSAKKCVIEIIESYEEDCYYTVESVLTNIKEPNCVGLKIETKYGEKKNIGVYAGAKNGTESIAVSVVLAKYFEVETIDMNGENIFYDELPIEDQYEEDLFESEDVPTTLKKIFENENQTYDGYYPLKNLFECSDSSNFGSLVHAKTMNIVKECLEKNNLTETEHFVVRYAYENLFMDKEDMNYIEVLMFKKETIIPEFESFIVGEIHQHIDEEKIMMFNNYGIVVELNEAEKEVVLIDVNKQLEGQLDLETYSKEFIQCPECEGEGSYIISDEPFHEEVETCVTCYGKGYVENIEKMEEKTMNIDGRGLTSALKKLGNFVKTVRSVEKIEEKIMEIFPNACEKHVFEDMENSIHFITGAKYTGKTPAKKDLLEMDKHFVKLTNMTGLEINISLEENKINMSADVTVEYEDKWGCIYESNMVIKEIEIPLEISAMAIEEKIQNVEMKYDEKRIDANGAWLRLQNILNKYELTDVQESIISEKMVIYKNLEIEEIKERQKMKVVSLINRIKANCENKKWDIDTGIRSLESACSNVLPKELIELIKKEIKIFEEIKTIDTNIEKITEKVTGKLSSSEAQQILSEMFKNIKLEWMDKTGYCFISDTKIKDTYKINPTEIAPNINILDASTVRFGIEYVALSETMIVFAMMDVDIKEIDGEEKNGIPYYIFHKEINCAENEVERKIKQFVYEISDYMEKDESSYIEEVVSIKKEDDFCFGAKLFSESYGTYIYIGDNNMFLSTKATEKCSLVDIYEDYKNNEVGIKETVLKMVGRTCEEFDCISGKYPVYVLIGAGKPDVFEHYGDAYDHMVKSVEKYVASFEYSIEKTINKFDAKADLMTWRIIETMVK